MYMFSINLSVVAFQVLVELFIMLCGLDQYVHFSPFDFWFDALQKILYRDQAIYQNLIFKMYKFFRYNSQIVMLQLGLLVCSTPRSFSGLN